MTRVTIELVPRSEDALISELEMVQQEFPQIMGINIPDLLRFPLRSWDACTCAKRYFSTAIPHIRAIDLNPDAPLQMAEQLQRDGISEVLIVTGDPPHDMSRKVYPTTSIDVIRRFKRELPAMKVYAAIDPYRYSLRQEYDYIKRKIDAGADGFFTQPFFDLRFIEIYGEMLEGQQVFWGISPVTTEKSACYWETKNHVVFPAGFQPTFEWNINFAREVLAYMAQTKTNVYFMPIRTNIRTYLQGIFGV